MSTRIIIVSLLLAASAFAQGTAKAPTSEGAHYPNLIRADLPLYPPLARTAHVSGTVEIQVSVERGAVVDAQVKSSSSPLLSTPTLTNVKTWQFQSEDRATFPVTYVYQIEGEQTPQPENPKVELDLPRLVKVIARPFKPTCSDCGAQIPRGNGAATLDPKNGNPLCSLQQTVAEGNRESVLVSGVFSEGPEVGTLEDATCPKETTWVELALRSDQNKEKLRKFSTVRTEPMSWSKVSSTVRLCPIPSCRRLSESHTILAGAISQHLRPSWLCTRSVT